MNDYVDLYADCNECDTVEGVKNYSNKLLNDILIKINRTSTPEDDPLWTSKDVCNILGISIRTLDEYCSNGEISYYKPKKKRLFKQSDLDAFIDKGRRRLGK